MSPKQRRRDLQQFLAGVGGPRPVGAPWPDFRRSLEWWNRARRPLLRLRQRRAGELAPARAWRAGLRCGFEETNGSAKPRLRCWPQPRRARCCSDAPGRAGSGAGQRSSTTTQPATPCCGLRPCFPRRAGRGSASSPGQAADRFHQLELTCSASRMRGALAGGGLIPTSPPGAWCQGQGTQEASNGTSTTQPGRRFQGPRAAGQHRAEGRGPRQRHVGMKWLLTNRGGKAVGSPRNRTVSSTPRLDLRYDSPSI